MEIQNSNQMASKFIYHSIKGNIDRSSELIDKIQNLPDSERNYFFSCSYAKMMAVSEIIQERIPESNKVFDDVCKSIISSNNDKTLSLNYHFWD